MKVLFISGTGVISTACSELALARGIDLYLLNRGQSGKPIPSGAKVITGDIRRPSEVSAALGEHFFDVVVDWIAFGPEHIEVDLELFRGRTGQFIFISSASAYQTPPNRLPITESTPLHNPVWPYSQAKIAAEERLMRAYRDEGFPMTIVRPSHTYDHTKIPLFGYYTAVDRMRRGLPIVIHGDGTSLWTLTHARDFAQGFVGLLGHPASIGEAFHITSDEWLTWNQIAQIVARAAGTTAEIVHAPSELINAHFPDWGVTLLGDKANNMVFDNSKVKSLVPDFKATIPYARGAEEVMAWYDGDPDRPVVLANANKMIETVIAAVRKAWPQ